MAQLVKNPPAMQETWVRSLGWKDPLERERLPTAVLWPGEFHGLYSIWGHKESDTTEQLSLGFPRGSEGKASACNAGDLGLIPGLGRSSRRRKWQPTLVLCLENPMNGEACRLQSMVGYSLWGCKESDTTE